jgi:hypothetical protein
MLQLDILAGVKVSGRVQGQVLVNGMPRKHCGFAALASYVQQKDVLVPSATVRTGTVAWGTAACALFVHIFQGRGARTVGWAVCA